MDFSVNITFNDTEDFIVQVGFDNEPDFEVTIQFGPDNLQELGLDDIPENNIPKKVGNKFGDSDISVINNDIDVKNKSIKNVKSITAKLDEIPASPLAVSEFRWNPHDLCWEFGTGISKTQINQEQNLPVVNHSGVDYPEGALVYISGYNDEYYQVSLSDNRTKETAQFHGMLTAPLKDGGFLEPEGLSLMTELGLVRQRNTLGCTSGAKVYMAENGAWTCDEPLSPRYIRIIGRIGRVSETEGEIFITGVASEIGDAIELLVASGLPNGIPRDQKPNVIITYDYTTRTINVSGTFYYFNKSVKYIKTSFNESLIHANSIGIFFVYFQGEVLNISSTPWVLGEVVPVAVIEYNNTVASTFWLGPQGRLLCERHGSRMGGDNHQEAHDRIGCYALDGGFALAGYTQASGSGGLTANTFSIDSGTIKDEDNKTILPAVPDNNGVGNVYTIRYKLGSQWLWFKSNLPYLFTNSNILYNPIVNALGSLVQVTSNTNYVSMFMAGVPLLDPEIGLPSGFGYEFIIGQWVDTTITNARNRVWNSLDLSGLPAPEYAPLYQIIFQRQNSYDDNGNCRIEEIRRIVGTSFVNSSTPSSPTVHNNLSGRSDADCHPISAITGLEAALNSATPLYKTKTILVADWSGIVNANGLYEVTISDADIVDNTTVVFTPTDNSKLAIWKDANIYPGVGTVGSFKLEAESKPTDTISIKYTIEGIRV